MRGADQDGHRTISNTTYFMLSGGQGGRGRGSRGSYGNVPPIDVDDFAPGGASMEFRDFRTPSGKFYCPLCDVTLNTEMHMAQHALTKDHKQKNLNKRYENMTSDK